MPEGNALRRNKKTVYLSANTREMLVQGSIICNKSESAFVEDAINEKFEREYRAKRESYGSHYWDSILEKARYPQRLPLCRQNDA